MNELLTNVVIPDALWVIVFGGWILLILTGLEADKPLSGGIPGHLDAHHDSRHGDWDRRDRLGEIGAWLLFGVMSLLLPFVLYWTLTTHG